MPRGTAVNSPLILPPPPPAYSEKDQREVRRLLQRYAAEQADWNGLVNAPDVITTIAGLTGAADTVPYFTGVSTMALATLTPYARTILAAAAASDARTLLGLGALAVLDDVTESEIVLADVTTLDVSTMKHGFAPKLPNDATKYLDGTGAFTVPAGGGGTSLPTFPTLTTGTVQGRFSAETTVSTITMDGDSRVSNVTDASGNWGSALTASTTKPRWMKRAMNGGRPGFIFDGSNAKLTAGGTKAIAQPLTVIAVVQDWVSGTNNNNVFRDSAGGPVLFISTSNSYALFAGSTLSSTTLFSNSTILLPNGRTGAPSIIIAVANGASSILGSNGTEVTGDSGSTGISGTMNVGGDSSTSKMNGVLYEILFISGALSATDRAALVTYYAQALGLSGN